MFTCDKSSWSAYFYKFLSESYTMINQWFSSALWVPFTVFSPRSWLKQKVRIWTFVHKFQRVVSFKANVYLLPKIKNRSFWLHSIDNKSKWLDSGKCERLLVFIYRHFTNSGISQLLRWFFTFIIPVFHASITVEIIG